MIEYQYEGHLIHYDTLGQGRPLVLLHGFMEDSSIWSNVSKTFSKSFEVIVIDLPCHGKSRFNGDNCSMILMSTLVDQLLHHLNLSEPIVIGHSMGGYVGLELAKIRNIDLILLHSNFWDDPEEKKKDRNRVIELVQQKKDHFISESIPGLFAEENKAKCVADIASLIKSAQELPSREIAAATAGMRDRSNNAEIAENNGLVIIQGEHDPIISDQKLREELALLEQPPEVIVLPNCGHMSMWEAPEALLTAIKKAIKSRN
ncbi:MAG: alpha/beta hydrolase [Crocinitomicaceae bacterium]|nr:alpha/beta hydrolase [Crocinitomicaceae bacterium]